MKTLARLGAATFVSLTAIVGAPATLRHEGVKLAPYYDTSGVKTWCAGETEKGYKERFTYDECSALFKMRYGYYSLRTAEYYNSVAREIVTPEIHASFVDMSYNVGLERVKNSSMIRLINQGDSVGACNAILRYKFSGGKDCSIRDNRCYGIWTRRLEMHKLCMGGI